MEVSKIPKIPKIFECELCYYKTSNLKDYTKHLSTRKHKKKEKGSNLDQICPNLSQKKNPSYICLCGKTCKTHGGIWKHKKSCKQLVDSTKNQDNTMNVILEVIKQNQEFKELLVDQNKSIVEQNNKIIDVCKNGMGSNNTVNSNNKAFSLNVFLNDDCKDAMNVTQFIDSFVLQLSDFENVGKLGFVNGISDIIIKKLKSLDENERPIHCTDQKRQVLYAKVIDKWEKEGDDNKILRKIIKCVAFKNSKNIQLFRDKYPDCMNWDSKHADRYQILRIESLGGLGNEDVDNENKIIRKIAREITLDKNF